MCYDVEPDRHSFSQTSDKKGKSFNIFLPWRCQDLQEDFSEAAWDRYMYTFNTIINFIYTTNKNNLKTIGKARFLALKDSFLATGLTTRVHGNKNNKPKHALTFDEIKYLVTFLTNYAERHAILLPGRIPGYKKGRCATVAIKHNQEGIFSTTHIQNAPSHCHTHTCHIHMYTTCNEYIFKIMELVYM